MTLEAFCHWCRSTITLYANGRWPAHITVIHKTSTFADLIQKLCLGSGTKATVWWEQGETR